MADYLVDNSVWVRRTQRNPAVLARLKRIEKSPSDSFVTCPPQVLEFCHSALPGEYTDYRSFISLGFPLEKHPEETLVLDIQQALWENGLFRAAGPIDILIAAYAIENDAVVLACDHDFNHIAKVSALQHEFLEPSA
jgi:predicted nucleic acid-binding protein